MFATKIRQYLCILRQSDVILACVTAFFRYNNFDDWMKLMAKVSPVLFFKQVKQEVKKVTWPTKKEVMQTSLMVLILVAIAAAFFFCVDQVFGFIVKLIFG